MSSETWSPGDPPTDADLRVLPLVPTYLRRGLDLLDWWKRTAPDGFAERFDLATTFNRPDFSYGFFDEATVGGGPMPVMGNYQEMLYDQPKAPTYGRTVAADWMRDQMRQFILRYFMRVSDFRLPEAVAEGTGGPPPVWLRPLSFCPAEPVSRIGFGFTQLFYKRTGSGEVRAFPPSERSRIVDLRRIGTDFEWIVLKVQIFDFSFTFRPLGASGPVISLPLDEASYLVVSRDFVLDEDRPEAGELGHYGFGYAFVKNPEVGLLAYGPGEFDAAFERIDFHVRDDGSVRVEMTFVANRPDRILNLSLDPVDVGLRLADVASLGLARPLLDPWRRLWEGIKPPSDTPTDPVFLTIELVNRLTGGAAGRELCISTQALDREFLTKHFQQHYQTIAGSLQTWRQIGDWSDEGSLPRWVIEGHSA